MSDIVITTGSIGNLDDYVDVPFAPNTETVLAYLQTLYYHAHGASFIYPDKANPVVLTSSATEWSETGTIVEIIPANTFVRSFDLHWCSISDISADLYGIIDFFKGGVGQEIRIGSVDLSRTLAFSREIAVPLQVPQQVANTRISARFSDSTASSRTVGVKLYGHVYSSTLS